MRYAYLGPEGTFTEAAVASLAGSLRPDEVQPVPYPSVGATLAAVRSGEAERGVVPVESAGSYVAWAVGRYGGLPALRRWGRRVWIRENDLDRATAWFDRYGTRAVLIGRVLPVVRTFISLPAGIARCGTSTIRLSTSTANSAC